MGTVTIMVEGRSALGEPHAEVGNSGGTARSGRMPWLVAWLVFLPIALFRAGDLSETDTFWEIRTGLFTIQQGSLPAVDPFSWIVHGQPWTLNSWGFNVAVAAAYRLAGLPGVALACASVVAAVGAFVLFLARQLGASPVVASTLLLLTSPLLIAWFSARPQIIDYVAVLALTLLMRRLVQDRASASSLLAIGILTIVWVNLHAGALLGVAIVAATTAMVFARRSTRDRRGWCLAALITAAASSLINPYGIDLITQTLQVKGASTGIIDEWQHIDPADPTQMTMIVLGLVALVVAARRGDAAFAGALGVAMIGSVTAIRLLPILLLLALPVLAAFASHRSVLGYLHSRRVVLGPGAAVGVVALLVLSLPSVGHLGRPDPAIYPTSVVQEIPRNCRLFNSYLLGGFVLFERPDVQVSLDSRNDLYGAKRVAAQERVLRGKGDLAQGLAGAGCVLVPPTSGLAQRLAGSPQWKLKSSEQSAILFVRR
jgi:hypothetical protein